MNFLLKPDVVSAYVAFCALIFAFFELLFRTHEKKSERNTSLYSKYLYICQELEISINSINDLKDPKKIITEDEIFGYAKAHMIDEKVFQSIYQFIELAVPCFNNKNKRIEQKKVKKALEFCSTAESLACSINSFYQSILSKHNTKDEKQIEDIYNRLYTDLIKLKDIPNQSSILIYKNVDNDETFLQIMQDSVYSTKPNRIIHIAIYVAICIIFYIIFCNCFIK